MKPDGTIDLQKVRIFYDPLGQNDHAISASNVIVPEAVKKIAEALNGRELALEYVIDCLRPHCAKYIHVFSSCVVMDVGIPAKLLAQKWFEKARQENRCVGALRTVDGGVKILDSIDAGIIARQLENLSDTKILSRIFVIKFKPPALS